MKKNIGKIKQWANERVGGQKTQTPDEFQDLQQKTDARHSGIDKLHMATNTYIKIMSKKADSVEEKSKVLPLESLGSTMKIYGEEIGTDTPYGMGLVRFGNANEKIAKAQMEYVSRVRDDFLFGLSSSIEEFKQYQQLKRKLESRRLDYDAKLNKVQKSKKEKPELEEEMRAAKEKYEVTMEDINNKMFALNDSEDQHVQDLTTFLDAQLEYFKAAYEILESVKKDWVESSDKPSSRRKRTPIRSSTIDSTNSNSDGANSDNGSADNGSINSHSSHNRPKPSKRTSKLVKSDSSNNLNIPTGLSRNKSVSSGSSTRSVDLKKPGNTTQKKQVRAIFSYDGEDRDELAIEEGDIITVIEEAEGWWIGEIIDEDGTKRSGMFPANYTEPIPVESSPPKIPARRPTNLSRQSSPPIRQRHSQTSASQRPGSPTAGTPPIPSRSSKPPPARPTSSTSIPPRKAARSSTYEYSSIANSIPKTTTPPSITSRNSYIQDYVKETTTQDFGPCKECDCNDYSPNVFKKGSCKNCFHIHT
ncbi:21819_t:CDS:2 [Rhizophagus irregularis]|nr:21819_t:CDS:2 [Rhizophagus irregularis]